MLRSSAKKWVRGIALCMWVCAPLSQQAAEPPSRNVLPHAAYALQNNKKLVIGYLGGSITAGSGASNPEKTSWRVRTTEWFKKRFPNATIEPVNAAIGGTGSEFGVCRADADLLKSKPDLVFVEFAVNDASKSEDLMLRSMEGIVQKIRRANANADIVFVYTTMKSFEKYHRNNQLPPSVIAHNRIAEHYHIPTVNVGQVLWEEIGSGRQTWEGLTVDGVHPRDIGYDIYTKVMVGFFEAQDWAETSAEKISMPDEFNPNNLKTTRLVDAWEMVGPGWTKEEKAMGRLSHLISATTPGTELSFKFRGTLIGMFWMASADSGMVEWSIDGSAPVKLSSWSPHGVKASRGFPIILTDKLAPGEHELKIKILDEKNPKSTGTAIRIGAFLLADRS